MLKQRLKLYLGSDFARELVKADLTAKVVSHSELTYFRGMNVLEVDNVAKTITVMFGGAWSGTYDVIIHDSIFGRIDS